MRVRAAVLAPILVVASTSPLHAQGDIGVAFGGGAVLGPFTEDLGTGATLWSVHAGSRVGPKFHVEGFFDAITGCPEICAVYAIEVRQELATLRDDSVVFVTYGLAGADIYERGHEYRYTTYDGHEYVSRTPDHKELFPPIIPVGGIGVEHRLFGRVSLRVDAQVYAVFVLPVGARITAGLSLPIGRDTR